MEPARDAAIVAETCAAIHFVPSGKSCRGAIALAHVRVNWLTGGVEVVAADPPR